MPGFLENSTAETVGQSELEEALKKHGRKPPQGDRLVQFVVSGPYADGDEEDFRDIDDFARRGILAEADYLRMRAGQAPRPDRAGAATTLKRPRNQRETRYLVIAKGGHYHPALGLCDEPIGG